MNSLLGGRSVPLVAATIVTLALAIGVLCSGSATASPIETPYRPADVPTVPGPPQTSHGSAATYAKHHPNSAPPDTNNFNCTPTSAHPRPLIMVHGTDASAYSDYAGLAPLFAARGYCLFALNYGGKEGGESYGNLEISRSARQFAAFVEQVRQATRAPKVDVIGYSQGATVTRYYINKMGGAQYVHRWIGLASPSYGGVMYGAVTVAEAIPGAIGKLTDVLDPALIEQMQGSEFLTELNAGGDTVPGVEYTTIGSRYDEMIQPSTNVALHGPGATNIVIQDLCPLDQTGHFNMPYDPFTQQLVLNALDPGHAVVPPCQFVPLGTGIPEVIWSAHS
ncbi:alpha/beta fold hydrolase [Skermania sp. ID1734]|uniref:esterase/lipase family protein n=1 Tax=Skermania sp. ID1734 TaxID=2597516 RepID=UPI00117C6DA2|nr:alpha/beta fold hydrolase [Skermania sp. ID1734]TSD94613.1 alpha/beta fold hydrolase [Skermania sp. ID1734]